MSNPTIDLSKDLELWCDLAPRYYDSQRNRIQDKSGYGRHAEASGGPTIGVEGPNDFQAASLDGSDDYFIPQGLPDNAFKDDEYTNAILVKHDGDSSDDSVKPYSNMRGQGDRIDYNASLPRLSLVTVDGNDNAIFLDSYESLSKWKVVVTQYNLTEDIHRLVVDGETKVTAQGVGYTPSDGSPENYHVGANYNLSTFSEIDVAYVARWSRALTQTEIEYLTRLTAPRRAQL